MDIFMKQTFSSFCIFGIFEESVSLVTVEQVIRHVSLVNLFHEILGQLSKEFLLSVRFGRRPRRPHVDMVDQAIVPILNPRVHGIQKAPGILAEVFQVDDLARTQIYV